MFTKKIVFFGKERILACDGKCNKAWGINSREKIYFDGVGGDKDPDDYAYYADQELGEAPEDPGTYEGGYGKPVNAKSGDDMNKWCARECCRSDIVGLNETISLSDFTKRIYNMPQNHRQPAEQVVEPKSRTDLPELEVTIQCAKITITEEE